MTELSTNYPRARNYILSCQWHIRRWSSSSLLILAWFGKKSLRYGTCASEGLHLLKGENWGTNVLLERLPQEADWHLPFAFLEITWIDTMLKPQMYSHRLTNLLPTWERVRERSCTQSHLPAVSVHLLELKVVPLCACKVPVSHSRRIATLWFLRQEINSLPLPASLM